jgi:hypothetical protein
MKKLKRKPMNKKMFWALSLTCLFSFHKVYAIEFGRIIELKGEGFISYNGKTMALRKGNPIEVGAEIVIEHRGQVTFSDNADHRFHLGNSSSASVKAQSLELRAGDLWFQSLNKNDTYKIQTANAVVNYEGGEAIISYDSGKGKTQLMVINSVMKLANLRTPELNLSISEGHFSFIDNAYDEGAPRDPTPVGEKTYAQLIGLFSGVAPMDKYSAALFKGHNEAHAESHVAEVHGGRAIASVTGHDIDEKAKMIEDYKLNLLNQTPLKKAVTNKSTTAKIQSEKKKSGKGARLIVHIYGQSSIPTVAFEVHTEVHTNETQPLMKPNTRPEMGSRSPASVIEEDIEKKVVPNVATPYSKDFKNQYKESDKLIDELKKL